MQARPRQRRRGGTVARAGRPWARAAARRKHSSADIQYYVLWGGCSWVVFLVLAHKLISFTLNVAIAHAWVYPELIVTCPAKIQRLFRQLSRNRQKTAGSRNLRVGRCDHRFCRTLLARVYPFL